jgi:serine/threonine protein phosphatase 1
MTETEPFSPCRIPDGLRVYAIGDIHGYASALTRMHDAISRDLDETPPESARIIYLGDSIDRGPNSAGVLDIFHGVSQNPEGIERTFIKGNHEAIALTFLEENWKAASIWLDEGWGGADTIRSYGVPIRTRCEYSDPCLRNLRIAFRKAVTARGHLDLLKNMQIMEVLGDYVFVHAGVHPDRPIDQQRETDLTRIREPFLTHSGMFGGKRVVHGHSICLGREPVVKPNRIAVDTGIYTYGVLTAAVLEGEDVRFLQVKP